MKRSLVTGAAGFIGANLALSLAGDGCEVHGLVRPGTNTWRLAAAPSHIHLHEVAESSPASMEQLLRDVRPAWIFHTAAHGGYPGQIDAARIVQANLLNTIHLVDAALNVGFERFVHTGSSSEYGYKNHPCREDEPLDPNSTYAVSKAAATMYCRHVARRSGAAIAIARLYSVYGPWEEPSRLVPTLLVHAVDRRLPPLVNPETARDFVYVDDVVGALRCLVQAAHIEPGEVVNVGTGRQRTLKDVVTVVQRLAAIDEEPQWGSMAARAWDTDTWVADVARIRERFGWTAAVSLDEGLERMWRWFEQSPQRVLQYQQRGRSAPVG